MRKRLTRALAALLAVVMLAGCFALPASATEKTSDVVGDVNGDGVILPNDAAIIARYLARWEDYVDEGGELTYPESETTAFSVGYAKVDITPDLNYYKRVPLAGYGNTGSRLASGIPDGDGLYLTCIAIRDEEGATALLFTIDLANASGLRGKENATALAEGILGTASTATGIPEEYMSINCSHTHSGPDKPTSSSNKGWGFITRYCLDLFQKSGKLARRAIADLTPATLWAGDTCVTDMNFVRRRLSWYSQENNYSAYQTRALIGDDHVTGYEGPNPVDDGDIGYELETPADNEVQYIVFKRDGVKDVLLYNWSCHADVTGNNAVDLNLDGSYRDFGAADPNLTDSSYDASKYLNTGTSLKIENRIITADYVTGVRRVLDEQEGYLTAFFNGGSGNNNYYDAVGYATNKQFGKEEYEKYRLPGWSDDYYDYADDFTTGTGRKGYWKSQMIGAIVADAILRDVETPYVAYAEPQHNDVLSTMGRTYKDDQNVTQPVVTHNWTDDWQGMRQLPTGKVNAMYSTFHTTQANNDRDLQYVMQYLSDLHTYDRIGVYAAGGNIPLQNSYTVTYGSNTLTVTSAEIAEIRAKAATYAAKTTDADRKAYAWEVLDTYRLMVTSAFAAGIEANKGQNGDQNVTYKKARLLCRLATGLYVSNYYASRLETKNGKTDLTHLNTDLSTYVRDVKLSCISIGQSVAFSFMPYESFDTLLQMIKDGRYIRYEGTAPITETRTATKPPRLSGTTYKNKNNQTVNYPELRYEAATYEYTDVKSPFALTFTCGYSNGSYGYMPTLFAFNHPDSDGQNGYETYVTPFIAGTGEAHAAEIIEMLNILYNDGDTTPREAYSISAD